MADDLSLNSPGFHLPERPHQGEAAASRHATVLGPGRLLRLRTAAGRHAMALPDGQDRFSLVLLMTGQARLSQGGRRCELGPGGLTVVDGRHPFLVETAGDVDKLVIELPRGAVLSRHPDLERCTAMGFDRQAGQGVVRDYALSLAKLPSLEGGGGDALFAAAVELLGVLGGEAHAPRASHRSRALAEIRLSLGNPALSASLVAERIGVSRRQLDAVFASHGASVTEEIWEQRLGLAARLLSGAGARQRKLIDIALSCGFSEPAHFSRAFKRRFGMTPAAWRGRVSEGDAGAA